MRKSGNTVRLKDNDIKIMFNNYLNIQGILNLRVSMLLQELNICIKEVGFRRCSDYTLKTYKKKIKKNG